MPINSSPLTTKPEAFRSAEEAWFWLMNPAGVTLTIPRPCLPFDVIKIVEKLYRQRQLTMDHIRVLRFYGQRQARPNPDRTQERHAHYVWRDALQRLGNALEQAGYVQTALKRAVIDFSLERAMKASA